MNHKTYQSFAAELVKIAEEPLDAGVRETLARRYGRPYRPGGELESNAPASRQPEDVTKLGYVQRNIPLPMTDNDLSFRTPSNRDEMHETYQKLRGPGGSALKGGFGGVFLGDLVTGGRLGQPGKWSRIGKRGFGLIGAGAGLADYVLRGKYRQKELASAGAEAVPTQTPELSPIKVAMIGSRTFTPKRQLQQSRSVGSYQDKVTHKGSRVRPPSIGYKFRPESS